MAIKVHHDGATYNSTLCRHGQSWELRLRIPTLFLRWPGGAPGPDDEPTQPWTDQEWEGWRQRVTRMTNEAWSDKFWLVPARSGRVIDPYLGTVPPVRCTLRLERPQGGDVDLVIHGYRLAAGNTFMRSFHRDTQINELHLDNYDTDLNSHSSSEAGICTAQFPLVHEIGHVLGLGHVARECSALQYGPTADEYADVMGGGMARRRWHATPWLDRINAHLRATLEWRVSIAAPDSCGEYGAPGQPRRTISRDGTASPRRSRPCICDEG